MFIFSILKLKKILFRTMYPYNCVITTCTLIKTYMDTLWRDTTIQSVGYRYYRIYACRRFRKVDRQWNHLISKPDSFKKRLPLSRHREIHNQHTARDAW